MKAKYILLAITIASVFSACSRDEKSLFDKSAAERAQEALDNAQSVLTAPSNGWEMLYFANTESEGYNIVVKFDKNGKVEATAKNSLTTEGQLKTDSSTWVVANDYGPILSFDTYNKVLHAWSDPDPTPDKGSKDYSPGDGYLGDYEFLILHADANYIKLKGKKHSAYCYMYPLKSGITAAEYFSDIEAMQNKFFRNGNLLHVSLSSGEFLLHNGSTGYFALTQKGESPNIEEYEGYPFATRQDGIQLMIPIREQGSTTLEFTNNTLTDGSVKIFAAEPHSYFMEFCEMLSGTWVIDIADVNETTKQYIADVDAALKKAYPKNKKASVQGLKFKLSSGKMTLVLSYLGSSSSKAVEMKYNYSIKEQGSSLQIAYEDPADDNAQKVLNAFPSLEPLFKSLDGSHSVTASEPINPSLGIKLTNNSNSAVWFNLSGN